MLDIIWTIINKYIPGFVKGKFGKERPVILLVSLIATLFIYDFVVDAKDNIVRQTFHQLTGEEYLFQGGSCTGTYYRVGEKLQKHAREEEVALELIENKDGSNQILDKLIRNSYSFGLAQEDILDKAEISRKDVRVIAPLYAERMHILYRTDKWQQISGQPGGVYKKLVLTKEHLNPDIRELLMTSRVRLASSPPHTGNVPLSTQLLEICGITPQHPVYKSFTETFEGLLHTDLDHRNAVDVALIVAGAPVSAIAEELKKQASERKIGLISIDSEVLEKLNLITGLNYRLTRFVDIYHSDFNHVSTISIRALLLASNNISDASIGRIAGLIKKEIAATDGMPPLKEFSFIKRVPTNNKTLAMVLRDWGVFVLGIGLIFVVISIFLTWAISSYKRASYTQEITKIYRDKLPSHIKLNKKSQIPKPVVEGDNKKIITEIVEGISELLKLAMMLREDYDSGGLIMSHQRYLLDNIYSIKDIFKTHLGQRMNQAVENNEIRVTKEDLAAFYTAGYLYAYDYNALLRHLKSPAQKEPVVAVDG